MDDFVLFEVVEGEEHLVEDDIGDFEMGRGREDLLDKGFEVAEFEGEEDFGPVGGGGVVEDLDDVVL